MTKSILKIAVFSAVVWLCSCNPQNPPINNSDFPQCSFYLLNEGTWGTNNATLDYYDHAAKTYKQNYFSAVNPSVIGGLGDVGNDLRIYGNKLYAVINASNKVEVMNAKTAEHIGFINVPNCRQIAFYGDKAYVTSFAGAAGEGGQVGYVAELDTATLQETRRCYVGYQPEGVEAANGKLYVASSGGYNAPNYDNRIFVIDIQSFTEIRQIVCGLNLSIIDKDNQGKIYVLSVGNYADVQPDIYIIDPQNDNIFGNVGIKATKFCVSDGLIYILSNELDAMYNIVAKHFYIYNPNTQQVVTDNFISDGTEIKTPCSIAVNSVTKEIFVTDAVNYTSPGKVFCFTFEGKNKWIETTGVIPSKIAFLK